MSTLSLIVPHLLLRYVLIWMKSYIVSFLLCCKRPRMNWPCLMLQTHLLYLLSLLCLQVIPSGNPAKPNFLLLPNCKILSQLCAFAPTSILPLSVDYPTNLSLFYEILTSFWKRSFPAVSPWNLLSLPLVSGDVSHSPLLSLCVCSISFSWHIYGFYISVYGMSLQNIGKFLKSGTFFFEP